MADTTVHTTREKDLVHKLSWTIDDIIEKIGEYSPGDAIRAGNIKIGSSVWYMLFYPNGEDEDQRGYISMFLYLENTTSSSTVCSAKWSCHIEEY